MAVDDHNHLALLIVLQDLVGAVDLRVLVDQAVARIVPDHFDRHIELIFATHPIAQGGHFRAALNRISPHKHRDAGLNRILQRRHTFKRQTVGALARAAIAAVDPDVTGQNGEHRDSPGGDFAVGMTLRPPALADIGRFGAGNFARQFNNAFARNTGYGRGPLRRFGDTVGALAKDPGFIVAIGRGIGRQGFLVVSHTVFIEERLIDQILGDHHPRQTRYQRRIGAGANRDPFIFASGGGVGIARIDNDHPGIGFLARLLKIVGHPAAAHPRFPGVVAEQHYQLAVFNIRRAVAICPTAVGVIQPGSNLRG